MVRPRASFNGPVAVLLALGAAMFAGCENADVVTTTYATYHEARQAGAVDRGWMPDGLPPGASDIREAHDLDTNRRWGLFSFPESEAMVLRRMLGPDVSLEGQRCEPPSRIEWWPILLRGRIDPVKLAATGLSTYRLDRDRLSFAVNWRQRRAYYWSPE